MKLVLITGAGASRRLGADGDLLPLMPDWSDRLCAALNEQENGLADACCLRSGLDGEEFEQALGLLLRWRRVRSLEQRFEGLLGNQPGERINAVLQGRTRATARLDVIMGAINATLYEQFGQGRVVDEKATAAYDALLNKQLDATELVIATTNYDRSAEAALHGLGLTFNTGFRTAPSRTPILEPVGLVQERDSRTPVIHLHGAVGWYERDGKIEDHYGDQPYNPSLGTPVVLYPDPEKDPTNDAMVSELWREFEHALDWADRVLLLGHSLHDPALLRVLGPLAKAKPVGATFYDDVGRGRVRAMLPGAIAIRTDFGPEPQIDLKALRRFKSGSKSLPPPPIRRRQPPVRR